MLSRNDARVFEVLYACALVGAIGVPLNWRLTSGELVSITRDAAPRVLVHESWVDPTVREIVEGLEAGEVPHLVGWAQAAVVGVRHARWGETGVAFVVPVRDALLDPEDLVAWCRARLAAYKVPAHVALLDELPRNATGKVLKGPLRDTAADIVS